MIYGTASSNTHAMRLIRPVIFGKVLRGRRRNKVNVRRIYPCFVSVEIQWGMIVMENQIQVKGEVEHGGWQI